MNEFIEKLNEGKGKNFRWKSNNDLKVGDYAGTFMIITEVLPDDKIKCLWQVYGVSHEMIFEKSALYKVVEDTY